MKLETYIKIFITSVLINLVLIANATENLEGFGEKPMASIVINGITNFEINDQDTETPFQGITITPDITAVALTVEITFEGNNGDISLTGELSLENPQGGAIERNGDGDYTYTATMPLNESNINNDLRAIIFTPILNQVSPGNTVETIFTLDIDDNVSPLNNSDISVEVTSINDDPVIGGIPADPIEVDDNDDDGINPFASITITDADFDEELELTISFDENAGTLNNGLTFSGTPSLVESYLQNLVFTPNENNFENSTVIDFKLTIVDNSDAEVIDDGTKVSVNPVNDAPSLVINNTLIELFDDETKLLFDENLQVNDPDAGEMVTVTITFPKEEGTILPETGQTENGANYVYSFSGTVGEVEGSLKVLQFDPAENRLEIQNPPISKIITFTITIDDNVDDNVTYTPYTIEAEVSPKNDAPFFENPLPPFASTIDENEFYQWDANAADVDFNSTVKYSLIVEINPSSDNPVIITNESPDFGEFWMDFDEQNGILSGIPKDGDDATYKVDIIASDGFLSTNEGDYQFPVIVNPVNSNPSFNLDPITENKNAGESGTVNINNILTYTIDPTNPNAPNPDPNQSIKQISLTSSNPSLFSALSSTFDPNDNSFDPNDDSKNDLEINYTIAAEVTGTAEVTVTVLDDGTENNSSTRNFTITVLQNNNQPFVPSNLPTYTINEDETDATKRQIIIEGITPGVGEEDTQEIILAEIVRVSSLSPIISGEPQITSPPTKITNGPNRDTYRVTIEYELVENAFGTVTFEILVEDNYPIDDNRETEFDVVLEVAPVDDVHMITQATEKRNIKEGDSFTLTISDFSIENPPNEGEAFELQVQEKDGGGYEVIGNQVIVSRTFGNRVLEVDVIITETAASNVGALNPVKGVYEVNILDVNNAPVITGQNPNPFTTSEEIAFSLTIDQLLIEDDNDDLSIKEIQTIPGGNYTVNGNLIIPDENFNDTLSVPVIVTDGTNDSNPYNVIINVLPVNDKPVIKGLSDPINIDEDDFYTINVSDLIIEDPDNDPNDGEFTLEILEGDNYSFNGNIITPSMDFFGNLSVQVQVNDGSGADSDPFTINITVLPVNDAPTINDITDRQVPDDNGQTLFVNFSGVTSGPNENLQNLTITASSGNESLIQEVEVIYTPNQSVGLLRMETIPNRDGRTTITVTVKDDGGTVNRGTDTKVVTFDVTVLGQNSAPTLDFISNINLLEDFEPSPVRLRNIRDGDDGSQQITITATSSNPALIPNPVINYVQGETEATLTYDPVPGQNGSATITVTVKDDGGTENGGEDTYIVTFEISILGLNDRPTIDAVPDTSLLEDSDELIIILTGITDGDLDAVQKMAITATSSRPEIIPDPTVIYDSVSTTAELILNPAPNISGVSTITITIRDDGGSIVAGQEDTRTITFQATVLPVNDQPTINPVTDVIRFLEGDPIQRQLISGITDGDPELIQIITSVTVTTNKPEFYESLEVAYREGDTNGEIILKTDPDANGMDTLTITVTDNGGTENGGLNTVSTLMYLDVLAQNDPPTITNLPQIELPKNADPDCIALTGITDGDPELEQNITITAESNRPDIIPDPEISEFKPNAGTATLCYEPLEDARGLVTITITLTDDGGIVGENSRSIELEINVGENNNAPEIFGEDGEPLEELNLTTAKDEPLAICFQVIDRDQDEVDLGQIISRNDDASGEIIPGSFTFKDDSLCFIYEAFPNTLSGGEDWFEFTICDDVPDDIACDTIRLNIEILPSADLRIFDGISPKNSDGKNDAWFIEGIENYPNNTVQIYATSGELVYEANGYDNRDVLWRGESNTGIVLGSRDLPTGVYYYVIDLNGGSLPPQKGSVIIK